MRHEKTKNRTKKKDQQQIVNTHKKHITQEKHKTITTLKHKEAKSNRNKINIQENKIIIL